MTNRLFHAIRTKPLAGIWGREKGRAACSFVLIFFLLIFSFNTWASTNQSFVYQGKIVRPDGSPANSGTITFTLSVYSPAPSECLLYQETQTVAMTGSYGLFKLALGTGTRTDAGAHTFLQAFVNGSTLPGLTCTTGNSYTAGATDDRDLRVSFNDAGTIVSLSAMAIKSVPFALQAHEVDGWGLNNLVKVSAIGSPTTFTTTEMANAKLLTAPGPCANGEILKWNGTAWACASDATGGSPVDASFAAKGIVQGDTDAATAGLTFTSGVIKVNSGTGANQIVKLDASAKLPAVDGSALTNLDPTHLSAAIPINKGGTGQITAILGFNALSPITTKGDLITSDGTNNVRLPAGTNGYVLTADSAQSAGIKWAPITAGTVTSVSSANSDISVAGGTSTPVLTLNSGTGANQIVKLDGSAKLPAVDGSALTNLNAGNISSGTLPVSRGGTGATSFAGNAVIISNNAGTSLQALNCTSGQVITFDASGYAVCGAAAGANGFVNGGNSFGANATLGTNDNYSLSIKTNNTSRMTILSTGEIGIGTTNPAAILDIQGGTSTTGAGKGITLAAQSAIQSGGTSYPGGPVNITGGNGYTYANSGQVSLMAGSNATSTGGSLLLAGVGYGFNGGNVTLTGGNTISGTNIGGTVSINGGTGQYGATTAPILLQTTAGYVGIGTTNPSTKLDVIGSGQFAGNMTAVGGNIAVVNGSGKEISISDGAGFPSVRIKDGYGSTYYPSLDFASNGAYDTTLYRSAAGVLRTPGSYIVDNKIGIGTSNPGALLDIGMAGSTLGTMRLEGNTSGYVQIQPSAAAGSWTMTLPANAGTNGYVLSTNGSGVTSWIAASGGSVTSVSSANTDIAVATGTSTPVLTLNSGTGANQIVKLDGSSKLPAVDGSALTNLNAGNISSGTLPIARGGTSTTSFASNAVIVSNGTGSALQALNCTIGQVITFNASGYAVCGASGSASFVNGGNSFAAAASLGTNDNNTLSFKTNNTSWMTIGTSGSVGIGTSTPAASSLLELSSTAKGFLIPRMTAAQRDAISSPAIGLQVYNTDTNFLNYYNGSSWQAVGGSSNTVSITSVSYGNGAQTNTCGTYVQTACNGYSTCSYTGSNANCGGDPASGFAKTITVNYNCGTTPGTQVSAENVTSTISCAGFVNGGNAFGGNATLGTTDAYSLGLKANNTTYMTILTSGNVGIGTTAPNGPLEVTGKIHINFPSALYSSSNFPVVNHSVGATYTGAVNAYSAGNDTVGAFHGAVANVNSTNTRSFALIGIGRADTTYNTAFTTAAVTNGAWLPGVGFAGYSSSSGSSAQVGAAINGVVDGAVSNGVLPTSLVIRTSVTDSSGLTEKMRVTSAGSVGIGVTAPAEKLEVNGAIKLGTTATSNAGTIRWDGTNFQGYNGSAWANFVPNPPASGACDTTNTYTVAGTYSYTVPAGFATVTIRLWGGGGGGGGANTSATPTNGGASSINSLGLTAGGGIGGETKLTGFSTNPGAGGIASGGSVNTNGSSGSASSAGLSGAGGSSPNGGAGGNAVSGNAAGRAGSAPGGGGSGGSNSTAGAYAAGGGSGAYVEKTFTTATLLPGTNINDIIVGAGGSGISAADGAVGRVSIACSTTGAPAANDRGVVFLSSNQHQTDTNFVFTAAGNVGIGTSSPDEKLVVSNGTTIGKYTTSGWTHSSDRRLKHDIQPLQDSLNKILQLQGVEYKFNADPSQKTQVGFIAQQVEPVFPEVVVTDDHGYKSMIYSNLVAPLVESVKALYQSLKGVEAKQNDQARAIAGKADQSEIEKLKSDNLAKEKEIQDLKRRLEKLEKALDK